MTDKHRKFMVDKIEELGLYEAGELFGLSIVELISHSGIKITNTYANEVLLYLIDNKKIPTEYKGFTIEDYGDYTVAWYGIHNTDKFGITLRESIYCFATPFYEGGNVIPIDFNSYILEDAHARATIFEHDQYGDYQETIDVDTEFESIKQLIKWYKGFYLPQVYDKIVNECLPMVREIHKDEILKEINDYYN